MLTAVMQLLKDKPLSAISVSEISKRAGVSRMTFYRNYSSKEDIFSDHLKEVLEEYAQAIPNTGDSVNFYSTENILLCFSYFPKHKDFIKCLLEKGFAHLFCTSISNFILNRWYLPGDDIDRYYVLQAFSGSLINVFQVWVSRRLEETPEQLESILYQLYC